MKFLNSGIYRVLVVSLDSLTISLQPVPCKRGAAAGAKQLDSSLGTRMVPGRGSASMIRPGKGVSAAGAN